MNRLFFGDNLNVLREHIPDESVDLIYLDPPFNSDADYNVLFKTRTGEDSPAQIKAFTDTWRWDQAAALAFDRAVCGDELGYCDIPVSRTLQGLHSMLGECDMLAYLAYMAPRLLELRRVMKPTASIYLHCDPTASHYLKLLLDAVLGPENYRNEIVWKRTSAHSDARRKFADATDTILFYSYSDKYTFNPQYVPYSDSYIKSHYNQVDEEGRAYTTRDLRSPSPRPNLTYDYKGYKPHPNGWSVSLERMQELDEQGRLYFPKRGERIRIKLYLDEMPGTSASNVWDDIPPLNSQAQERLGYPTQKPEALLERIIRASSREGDVVLDPFCGCGTAVAAAQKLGRTWIGVDVTHIAITLIKHRLRDQYGDAVSYKVLGEPVDIGGARELAEADRHQFEMWALGLVGARPGPEGKKKGADRGIDGRIPFRDEERKGTAANRIKQALISVKSGKNVGVADVRDLLGTVERERAQIGVFITLEEPTRHMRREAASAGFYRSPFRENYPRIQVLTVAELLAGARVDMPRTGVQETYRRAPAARRVAETGDLFKDGR